MDLEALLDFLVRLARLARLVRLDFLRRPPPEGTVHNDVRVGGFRKAGVDILTYSSE